MMEPARLDKDVDLLASFRMGSADGFAQVVRRHQAAVRAYLTSYLRDRAIVDDLAQETFLRAYRDRETFKGGSTLLTWLLGIARHRALETMRARARRDARIDSSGGLMRTERLIGLLERGEADLGVRERELAALKLCLEKLAPRSAALVASHYFHERPLADIAREGGRKESTVRVELLRIRAALRRCLAASLGEEALP